MEHDSVHAKAGHCGFAISSRHPNLGHVLGTSLDAHDREVRSAMPVEALAVDVPGESLLAVSAGQVLRRLDGGRTFVEEIATATSPCS